MARPALKTVSLTKTYRGRPVIRNVNLEVARGEVYALVGPNGAGKTTFIRLVTGLAFPTSGEVELLGGNPHREPRIRARLGALAEAPAAFYPYLSGRENLALQGRLAGGVSEDRISEVLNLLELSPAAERKVGVYSLGMRQRLGVASAILMRPAVLILDEPASGMDPLSLHLVHRVLRDAAADGTSVFISTHHLEEVVSYCSRVGIMEEGALVDEVDLERRALRYRLRVSEPASARVHLQVQPFVQDVTVQAGELLVTLADPAALGRLAPVLADGGSELLALVPDTFDLRAYYAERLARRDPRADGQAGERTGSA